MEMLDEEKTKLINLKKNQNESIKKNNEETERNFLSMENEEGKKESTIIKRYSKYSLLDELNNLIIKKKQSFNKRKTWDSLSNISKYSSDYNNIIEKKKILISLGNNSFGQLGFEKNKKVGCIDISSIPINKKKLKNAKNNKRQENCKKKYIKFNNILNEIKKRNRDSVQTYDINKSLWCDNLHKPVLTRHSSHLSFFTLKKNREKKYEQNCEKNYEQNRINSDIYRNIFTHFKDGDVNSEVIYNKINDSCVEQNRKRSSTVPIDRNYAKNKNDNSDFFLYDSEINYKKKKLAEYDDFLLINENVEENTRGSYNNYDSKKMRVKKEKEYFDPQDIQCGKYHSGIVSKQGFVCLWGLNNYGQLGVNPKKSVYTQYKKVGKKGKVQNDWNEDKLAKDDNNNKLDKNKSIFSIFNKKEKSNLWPYIYKLIPLKYFGYKHKVKKISLGSYHTMILTYDGYVFTFGCNKKGQLGLPNDYDKKIEYTSKPFMIPLKDKRFKLKKNDKNFGIISRNDNYKYPKISHPIIYIECGPYTNAIIDADKKLWMWGWNKYGQIDCSYINKRTNKKGKNKMMSKLRYKSCANAGTNLLNLKVQKKSGYKGENRYGSQKKKKKKKARKNEEGYKGNSNMCVNIPRKIKIKKKNIIQVSLGKYHSLCLTEERSVYVWGYLFGKDKKKTSKKNNFKKSGVIGRMKIKICCFEKKDNQDYHKNIIKITKIKCLSNLYITNIISSSTHTVFIAPVNFLNINGVNNNFLYTNKNAGDKYRQNILLKNMNENSKENILKYFSDYILTRGGDNIYYVKYTDLYYLLNLNENKTGICPDPDLGNMYYINNQFYLSSPAAIARGYYTDNISYNNNTILRNDELFKEMRLSEKGIDIEQVSNAKEILKVNTNSYHINKTNKFFEKIMKPLYIYNENNIGEINNIQIFRVGVGKNFCLFITSSSINKMMKDKKVDESGSSINGYQEWRNSVSTFDILRNNVPEHNLFCIGNAEYGQIILPSHCKQSNVPVHVHKNKLLNKITIKNDNEKYHKFLKIKSKRTKYSDKVNYNYSYKLSNLEKYYESIQTKTRTFSIGESRSRNSWTTDNGEACRKQSQHLLSITTPYLDRDFSTHEKSVSSQIGNKKLNLFSNYSLEPDLFKDEHNRMGSIRKLQRNTCLFNLANVNKLKMLKKLKKLKNNYMESDNLNLDSIRSKDYLNKSQSVFENVSNYNYDLKRKSDDEPFRGYISGSENMRKQINEIYDDKNSCGTTNKSINDDIIEESSKFKECDWSCRSNQFGSFYNKLYAENDINEKRSEIFSLAPEYYNDEHDHSFSIYTCDEKQDQIKNKRKFSLRSKKENFRNLILRYIDNINDNILKKKNYDKLNNNRNIKRHFKIFKKRNSCLWNYFTYYKKKKNNKYNSEQIVNINLLDVACGDYHSLVLVEVDVLS
ncbi:regulator of chromosome condensation, putative [Plasmodium chabaudi chabaudi]|uniref:Regulator of chromosome condensation, putative n=1 Tax=Plasmodium chabaudi chabaudi TaxID=31271 RepID=A0A1C6XCB2_PLACU|nr:regulator of chromosome condensation, putative [Plasmodium chabaudi chabaudi]